MDWIIIFYIVCGWVGGVLVNYLADVLPLRRKLTPPLCVHCLESVPLKVYLGWPRRCPACHHGRPWRVWVVELSFIAFSLWFWRYPIPGWQGVWMWVLMVYFGVVFVIDVEHRLIMHMVSSAGAFLGLMYGTWQHGWAATLLGGGAGFLLMLGVYYLGEVYIRWLARLRGQSAPDVALGFGDVNLAGVIGLFLGWPGIIAGLILAVILGGVVSLVYLLWMWVRGRYRAFLAVPYGPFLVSSAVILLFFKGELMALLW